MGIPPSLLGAERASSCQYQYSDEPTEFPCGRWARGAESQAPEKLKHGGAIEKGEPRRRLGKLSLGRPASQQDGNAAAVAGTLHVHAGVPNEPDRLARVDAAGRQGEQNRRRIGLV